MSNIYIKKDGITTKVEEPSIDDRVFRAYREDSIDLLTGVGQVRGNDKLYLNTKKLLEMIKKDNPETYKIMIKELAIKIANIKSLDELLVDQDSILNTIIATYLNEKRKQVNTYKMNKYYDYEIKVVKDSIKEDYLPSMSAIVKEVIKRYVHNEIFALDIDSINTIYKDVAYGANPLEYISINGVKVIDLEDQKLKQLIYKIILPEIRNKYDEGFVHLCFDCKLPICECPKMMDKFKKNIADYDFIVEGKQITHNEAMIKRVVGPNRVMHEELANAELTDEFLVTKCKKFIKTKGRV